MNKTIRRFNLVRTEDVSGVSGTGIVAVGAQMPTGKVFMEWVVKFQSFAIYNDIGTLETIHGHEGKTHIEWVDAE